MNVTVFYTKEYVNNCDWTLGENEPKTNPIKANSCPPSVWRIKGKKMLPLAFNVMARFLKVGFVLKEDIIKVQHHCKFTERWRPKARKDKFYLIMHEHLFVFRKPKEGEDLSPVR